MMLQLGKGVSKLESEMDSTVCAALKQRKFKPIKATTERGHKDYLEKIIQLIRGSGFGIAIFSEYTPASTLANIFFEIALCNLLGKPVILVKSEEAQAPSDFVRTEWVSYTDGNSKQLKSDMLDSLSAITKLAAHYETLGDLARDAMDADLELAFERYRQAALISNSASSKRKIKSILTSLQKDDGQTTGLRPARARLQNSINELCRLLP